ncbi:hypothetical protein U9M48_030200 [Paspalum notatum var. saurae]|uniref:Uncharacterized protein n=1 Tax=Paspalum notatum var. saurae TaxID=547442 RepID=A0AAQ3TZM8_PASNO
MPLASQKPVVLLLSTTPPRGSPAYRAYAAPRIDVPTSTGRALLLNPDTIPSPLHSPAPSSLAPRSLSASISPERRAPPARAALAVSSHTGRRKLSPPRPTRFRRSPHPPPSPRLLLSPRSRSSTSPHGRPPATAIAAVGSPWRALSGPILRLQTAAPKPARPARSSSTPRLGESPPPPSESDPRRPAPPSRGRLRFTLCAARTLLPTRLDLGESNPRGRGPLPPPPRLQARGSSRVAARGNAAASRDSANEGPTQKQSRTQWPEDEPVHPVPEDGVSLIKPSLFQGVAWGKASQPGKLTVA